MSVRPLVPYWSLALAFLFLASGSCARGQESDFDVERFNAAMKVADSRRLDLKSQMEAMNAYWDAMNKAVLAQRGAIRNRQLADAVTEIRRATMDANQKLADAEDALKEVRTLQQDRTNLVKGRGVTRAGVRAGWRALLKLHEASIAIVDAPAGLEQVGYEERAARNWFESTEGHPYPNEDCPADYATAIEVFHWASLNNLIPRPGTRPFGLVLDLIKESDAVLTKQLEGANTALTQAETQIVALRETSWKAVEPTAPAK